VAFTNPKLHSNQSAPGALCYFHENDKKDRQDPGADVYNDIGSCRMPAIFANYKDEYQHKKVRREAVDEEDDERD
jgi:hypothetical protein